VSGQSFFPASPHGAFARLGLFEFREYAAHLPQHLAFGALVGRQHDELQRHAVLLAFLFDDHLKRKAAHQPVQVVADDGLHQPGAHRVAHPRERGPVHFAAQVAVIDELELFGNAVSLLCGQLQHGAALRR
jgi:hypothetical protein